MIVLQTSFDEVHKVIGASNCASGDLHSKFARGLVQNDCSIYEARRGKRKLLHTRSTTLKVISSIAPSISCSISLRRERIISSATLEVMHKDTVKVIC